jgi:hypothetical protein
MDLQKQFGGISFSFTSEAITAKLYHIRLRIQHHRSFFISLLIKNISRSFRGRETSKDQTSKIERS